MKTFEELGVSADICRAIYEMGFVNPMPVQEEVIPYLLSGDADVVALAQTGTGKTAAFGLPVIQKLDVEQRVPQSLILCPTRELCLQIAGDLKDYSKYVEGVHVLPVYGGSSIESQIRALKQGVHIVVATPGRLLDLMRREKVSLTNIKNVVMDEADEMLDMGFSEDLNAILEAVPETRNTLMFSATMNKEIEKIAKNYLHDAKEITIGRKNESTHNVNHVYYCVHARDKYETLKRIVDYHPNIYAIIFCRTRLETQEIADKLMQDGYNADSLHGELSQAARDLVMQKFRMRHLQLLVATDVAARGLDVDDLTHVINYGLPDDIEYYTHRSGRTGRAGKTGTSIAIINLREKGKMRNIEKVIGHEFQAGEMPTRQQICKKQLMKSIDNLEKVQVNEEEINEFMTEVYRKLDWLSKEDVLKRVVSITFNRFLDYYRDRPEIEIDNGNRDRKKDRDAKGGKNGKGNRSRVAEPGFSRLFINMGRTDHLNPKMLMSLINEHIKGKVEIGRIDLMQNFSFFEVREEEADRVVRFLNGQSYKGRGITVEFSDPGEDAKKSDRKGDSGRKSDRRGGERRSDRDERRSSREDKRSARERDREVVNQLKEIKAAKKAAKEKAAKAKPSREERGYTKARGRKDDWKQFFMQDNDLKGEVPDFSEEGWAKKSKKKKK
ncbi:MAG: DEAD/DEAH box helicase [Bacteroidaceae bacterium]|nr:DEAD/DEAH box helicase [Bacteroidaceae bacterium]